MFFLLSETQMKRAATAIAVLASSISLLAISGALAGNAESQPAGLQGAYTPGLGDIMGAIQMRHAKLWFAGKSRNWQLAAYEISEIKEGFESAARFQPDFKGRPVAQMVEEATLQPINRLEKAVEMKNPLMFVKAFDQLTGACNSCHQAAGFEFISIQRPSLSPFTNQEYGPQKH
jgi:hypothetical protein